MTLRDQISDIIETEPVTLFMKGTPSFVACGNSQRALSALRTAGAPVTAVDILPDPRFRQELSSLSGWPTIPQVFVKGELVGGADIVEELAATGELERKLTDALGEGYRDDAGRARDRTRRSVSWRVAGTYVESCNCDAPCPCRRIDGVPGGRSTHGHLRRRPVLADRRRRSRQPRPLGPPSRAWRRATATTRRAHRGAGSSISTSAAPRSSTGRSRRSGRAASPASSWSTSRGRGSRATFSASNRRRSSSTTRPRRQWFRVRDVVTVRISGPYEGDETITCVIPGHEQPGEEIVADELSVDDAPLRFEYAGRAAGSPRTSTTRAEAEPLPNPQRSQTPCTCAGV